MFEKLGKDLYGKILILSLLVLTFTLTCFPLQSDDLFMYLAIAREYFRQGHFPTIDPFIYSIPNYSWTILHQWLSYLTFYGLYQAGGFDLIIVFKVVLIMLMILLPWAWMKKVPVTAVIWAVSVILALYASLFRFFERSFLFGDLLMLLILNILLAETQKPTRWKFIIPVLFLAWVNLHPGFPLGWALLGIMVLWQLGRKFKGLPGTQVKQWLIITFLSVAACLVNPRGLDGLLYPFTFAAEFGALYRKFYFEWYPTLNPIFLWRDQTLFLFLLMFFNLFLLFKTRKSGPVFEFLVSIFLIAYGLSAIRFVPVVCFALVTINSFLAVRLNVTVKSKKIYVVLAAIALCLSAKNIIYGYDTISGARQVGLGIDHRVVPDEAVEFLKKQNIQGNIFNSHLYGSYLSWALDSRRVFYHGFVTDVDFYLHDYAGFSGTPEQFQALINKYNIQALIIDRFVGEEALFSNIQKSGQWNLVYKGDGSVVFLKK